MIILPTVPSVSVAPIRATVLGSSILRIESTSTVTFPPLRRRPLGVG